MKRAEDTDLPEIAPVDDSIGHDAEALEGTITLQRSTLSWLGIFVKCDTNPTESFPNRIWQETGHSRDEMNGSDWLAQVHPADRDSARRETAAIRSGSKRREAIRYRIRDNHGRWRWVMTNGVVEECTGDGETTRFVGLDVDITEIHELQQKLEEARVLSEQRATEAEALRVAGAVIASSLNKHAAVTQMIDQVRPLLEVDDAQVFERDGRQFVTNDDQPIVEMFAAGFGRDALIEVMRRRSPDILREPTHSNRFWLLAPLVVRGEVLGVFAVRRSDGAEFTGSTTRLTMAIGDYLAVALNNARLYEKVRTLAETDVLTGLLTRRAFYEEAESALKKMHAAGATVSALLLDIDFFKRINDECGHQVGDRVIEVVASTFRQVLRSEDVMGRYGGEEFCALLPDVNEEHAREVGDRICAAMRELPDQSVPWTVTVSIGISSHTAVRDQDQSVRLLDRLIGEADAALYRAKKNGRDRVEIAP